MRRKLAAGLMVAIGVVVTRVPAAEADVVRLNFDAGPNEVLVNGGDSDGHATGSLAFPDGAGLFCIADLETTNISTITSITIDGPGGQPSGPPAPPVTAPPDTDPVFEPPVDTLPDPDGGVDDTVPDVPPPPIGPVPALAMIGPRAAVGAPVVARGLNEDNVGKVVIDLGTTTEGCVGAELSTLRAIKDDPGSYMIVIRTEQFPAGAVAGSLGDIAGTTTPSGPAGSTDVTSTTSTIPPAVAAVAVIATPRFAG